MALLLASGSDLAVAQAQQGSWTMTADTEARYYSWRDSLGNRGSQVFVPVGFQLTGRPSSDWKLESVVRSGYMWSSQNSGGASSNLARPVDLTLSQRVTYFGINGIQPFAAISVSIPTVSSFAGVNVNNSKSALDSDIVPNPVFGQGLNIGPSIGANIAVNENVTVGWGLGYTSRGSFLQSQVPNFFIRYNPGDVTTANLSAGYRGDALVIKAMLSYSWEQVTTLTNPFGTAPQFRAGDRIMVGVKSGYTFNDRWAASLNLDFTSMGRNQVLSAAPPPPLVTEPANSNSNMVRLTGGVTYSGASYTIGPTLSFLYRDRNGYDSTTFQFLPAKSTWTLGLAGAYDLGNGVKFNASVAHVWINQSVNPDKVVGGVIQVGSGQPAVATNAWIASFGTSFRM
ncbi:hypothetical protein [Phreatobacter oligotrophus]|nr:hypothetical protein [Phreatobacter oligotrophus]